jgi:hypothetical protein
VNWENLAELSARACRSDISLDEQQPELCLEKLSTGNRWVREYLRVPAAYSGFVPHKTMRNLLE